MHPRVNGFADRHVIQHFPPQSIGRPCAAFGNAADLQIDAPDKLFDAEAAIETALGQSLEQRADRPPERAQTLLSGDLSDAGDRIAHRLRAVVIAVQPREQAALVQATFLGKVAG